MTANTPDTSQSFNELLESEILPCTTGCGSNADPADGFGYCTCGAQKDRVALRRAVKQLVEGIIGENEIEIFSQINVLVKERLYGKQAGRNELRAAQRAALLKALENKS